MSLETSSKKWEQPTLSINNTSSLITAEACISQKEAFQKTLEENLRKWIDVLHAGDFEKFRTLLQKNTLWLDLTNIQFEELNNGVWVIIKKDGDTFKVYNQNNPKLYGNLNTQIGTFKNGVFEKLNVIVAFFSENHNRIQDNPVPQDIVSCEIEKPSETPLDSTVTDVPWTKKAEVVSETHLPYLIKKWDSLWKIIKKNYKLTDTTEDAYVVGNIINFLKKDPRNNRIIKDDAGKIFIWETLHLPKVFPLNIKGSLESFKIQESSDAAATPLKTSPSKPSTPAEESQKK